MPLSDEELAALILLNRVAGAARRSVHALLMESAMPSEILARIEAENLWGRAEELRKVRSALDPEKELERCRKKSIHFLTVLDSSYPSLLKQSPDPPLLLYVLGEWLEADQAALAMVGSRHPSLYGRSQAKSFARELSEKGLTLVSGLARGIDKIVHESCLEIRYGRTLAVLGSGVDVVYPRENQNIYAQIAERGALMSEYPLGTPPLAHHFPCRNRIIAGLSLGVFVVEAHSRSGSLITAHEALEMGREVFALPGQVDQLTSRGTHRLIKEGAALVDSPFDILEILASSLWPLILERRQEGLREPSAVATKTGKQTSRREEILAPEEGLVADLLSSGPLHFDEMSVKSSLASGLLASSLLRLEVKKKIQKQADGRFVLRKDWA